VHTPISRANTPNRRRREHGSVFLLAIVVLTVLFLLGASLIERAQTAVYRASIDNASAKSFQLAEGGIHAAIWALNQPNGWLTYSGEAATALPGGFVTVTLLPVPADRAGSPRVTLLSTGWVPGPNGTQHCPQTLRVVSYWEPDYFDFAIFGDKQVGVGNGDVNVWNEGDVSDVGTNGTSSDAVAVGPEGEVNGNVVVGLGATAPNLCVDNKGVITGAISALDSPKIMLPVPGVPEGAIELGAVKLSGGTLTLNEGVYHMTDLSMGGSAKIQCNGKVEVYLGSEGIAKVIKPNIGGQGIANTSQLPSNLLIYCLDNVVNLAVGGNGVLYGAIYAPRANIDLNAGDVYGSLIGQSVKINGADCTVYYDDRLSEDTEPHAAIRSWEVF